ncbi:MAG: methyltransferase domain-containing protein [Armatimonadetes bacterium]|nr:methyltransferase domain-containing protein [Armatimonadota bacterium]
MQGPLDPAQSFGPVAEHYDVLMTHVPYDTWVSYYQLLLAQIGVDPVTVLDVCCGTGNVTELLAKEGYRMSGFDLSAPMIDVARRKAKERKLDIRYYVADAADFQIRETFDGAVSFFDSLNYITDPDHAARAIRQVARHLNREGTFVFDVNTAYAFEQKMFDQKESRAKAPIRYDWVGDYDPSTRIIVVNMKFERDGRTFEERHVQRAHSLDEIADWLDDAGFEEIAAFDSYTLNPPRKKSDRLHFTAKLG